MAEPLHLRSVLAHTLGVDRQPHRLSPRQWQVCHHLLACRTEALGETRLRCECCGRESAFYRACRDRHCPRCQREASHQWCERQRAHTLEVTYFHVIFTLPQAINGWVEIHPEVIYDQLLKSTWATLAAFAADPKRLDGELGATLVLHTWGQTLTRHLHVHCLVPGGALTAQGRWKAARSTYLFPVRALARYFRGHFVAQLRKRQQQGEMHRAQDPKALQCTLDALMDQDWVVYTKPWLQHTDSVVAYLGRYSHRIALSESRLIDFEDGQVRLRYKDYRDHDRQKLMRLSAAELIRRFLLHVLPPGFMRIRHYGFLANRCRQVKLAQIRQAIGQAALQAKESQSSKTEKPRYRCPHCGQLALRVVTTVVPACRSIRPYSPPRIAEGVH